MEAESEIFPYQPIEINIENEVELKKKLSYYQRNREKVLKKCAEKYAATKAHPRKPKFATIKEYYKYLNEHSKAYYTRKKLENLSSSPEK